MRKEIRARLEWLPKAEASFVGPHGMDSLIVGYYDGDELMYVGCDTRSLSGCARTKTLAA
jgi:hypothetical protein